MRVEPDQTSDLTYHLEKRRDQLRLLVVEDEDSRAMLSLHMGWLGHHARFAEDVATACQLAEQETFDVLLYSLRLLDADGGGLLYRLAASRSRPLVAVAMGYSWQARSIARSEAAAFALHLDMPCSPGMLERTLQLARKWV